MSRRYQRQKEETELRGGVPALHGAAIIDETTTTIEVDVVVKNHPQALLLTMIQPYPAL